MNKEEQFEFWKNGVFNAIKDISDFELQNILWTCKNPELISSFTEMVSVLYDDFDFEGFMIFLENSNNDNELLNYLKKLDKMLTEYIKKDLDDLDILNDSKWFEITMFAKYTYELIKKNKFL